MKYKLLSAVASIAFISAGVAAQAQENPKRDQNPAAERVEPKAPAGQMEKRDNAMKSEAPAAKEAPRAAQTDRKEMPKAAEGERKEAPRAAESDRKEMPKAAEGERKEMPKAAESERKEAPRAAEGERKDQMRPASNEMKRQGEPATRTGANEDRNAAHPEGAARVTGNVKISSEHATRISEILGRNARRENVNIDIRVGERVPQDVEVLPLPAEVIAIAPDYRGYDYFVSNDQIVFVAPETHEIVGAIAYEGRAATEETTTRVAGARPCPVEQ